MSKRRVSPLFYVIFLLLCVLFPAESVAGARAGLSLFAQIVAPALFPFFVFSPLLLASRLLDPLQTFLRVPLRLLFRLPPAAGGVYLLSLFSGSPASARSILSLVESKTLSHDEALRLAQITSTCGPSFILGAVGASLLQNPSAGICLLLAHYLSAFFNGLLWRGYGQGVTSSTALTSTQSTSALTLGSAIQNAAQSLLGVGGYIVLFAILGNVACTQLPLGIWGQSILTPVLEISSGASVLSSLPLPLQTRVLLLSCSLSFGGICVLFQNHSFLSQARIGLAPLLMGMLTQSLLSLGLCFLLLPILSAPTQTAFALYDGITLASTMLAPLCLLTACIIAYLATPARSGE